MRIPPLAVLVLLGASLPTSTAQARFSARASAVLPDEVAYSSSRIAVGDVDGDGIDDLLLGVSDSAPDDRFGVRLYRGTTGIGYVDRTAQDVPGVPSPDISGVLCALLGDADGDGDLDAFLVRSVLDPALLLNDGTGRFAFAGPGRLPALPPSPQHAAFADLDNDGDLDLVLGNRSTTEILDNDGLGTFRSAQSLTNPIRPTDLAIGDLDSDGAADLVVTGCNDSSLWWGDGRLGFVRQSLPTGCAPSQILLADLDADGDRDLVFAFANALGGTTGRPDIRWNQGNRAFQPALGLPLGPHLGSAIAALDFDADGDLDLVLGGRSFDDRLQLWRLDPGRRFVDLPGSFVPDPIPGTAAAFAVIDPDGDGDPDLYVAGNSNRVGFRDRLLLGQDGRFFDTSAVLLASIESGPGSALLDIDGDHDVDLVQRAGSGLEVRHNLDALRFGPPTPLSLPNISGQPASFTPGDLDADGDIDLWLTTANRQMRLLVQQADGSFADETASRIPAAVVAASSQLALLEDFDGDGDLDLAIATGWGAPYLLLRNDGSGVFGYSPTDWPAGGFAHDIACGDLDADGDLDVVVSSEAPGNPARRLQRFLNDGAGRLRELTGAPIPSLLGTDESTGFDLGDVDGDGDADLLTSARRLWLNDGSGGFLDAPGALGPTTDLGGALLVDVDADGDLDAVLATAEGSELHENDGTGRFTLVADAFTSRPRGTAGHVAADVDDDGDLDLLPVSTLNAGVELQRNLAFDLYAPQPARLGTTFELQLRHPNPTAAVIAYSLSLLPTPSQLPFGTLRIDAGNLLFADVRTLGPGTVISRLPLPVVAGATGLPLYAQALVEDTRRRLRLSNPVGTPLIR